MKDTPQYSLVLTPVTNVADIDLRDQYIAKINGVTYCGKFIDASTGTFYSNKHFVWNGSVFPQGIPFECLDNVYSLS